MQDPAVVAGLVGRQVAFLLEDRDPKVGPRGEELVGRREADDPAADDDNVEAFGGHWSDREGHAKPVSKVAQVRGMGGVHHDAVVDPSPSRLRLDARRDYQPPYTRRRCRETGIHDVLREDSGAPDRCWTRDFNLHHPDPGARRVAGRC